MAALLSLAVAAVVIVSLAVVALTPRDHRVEIVATFPTTDPPEVWRLLTDHAAEPGWLPLFESVEREPDDHGRAVWTHRGPNGAFSFTLMTLSAIPPRRYERILLRDGQPRSRPWDGRWVFELEPAGGGTRLRITEHGWTGGFRFFVAQRILGSPHTSLEHYARGMGRALGDPARIEIVRTH
jgi:uncharacterized protein YndB with AHSA1/START domain